MFILVGAMVVLNLFIGVIVSGFDRAQSEFTQLERREEVELKEELAQIKGQLSELQKTLESRS